MTDKIILKGIRARLKKEKKRNPKRYKALEGELRRFRDKI